VGECLANEIANRVGPPRADDVILRPVLGKHPPHGLDILRRISPVTPGIEITEIELAIEPSFDASDAARDFAGNECFAPAL
jgi:hypothetical protein